MSDSNDGSKGLDRRAVMRGALAIGGASLLSGTSAMPQNAVISEREWARVLARHMANQLQEAARTVPELGLTQPQVVALRQAFENTLVTNMGCDVVDQPPA
jgi:predicted regulator of Ras-like GTPase activity (Roadblock/LC7/MglB family)